MFVRESTYIKLQRELMATNAKLIARNDDYIKLLKKWNELIDRLNEKGGEEFVNGGGKQFNEEEIKTLIRLCHPDKHNGRESAVIITQKLTTLTK